jgi:PAS domain S-box
VNSHFELGHLRRLLEALNRHAMVLEADLGGKITYANDAFCEASGYGRDELIGRSPRLFNSGHHSEEFFRDLWKTILSGRVWHGEIRNRCKNGSVFWCDTTILPLLDGDGKPTSFMSITYDITARYEQMAALRAALARAEQLAVEAQAAAKAKSEFLANMSHEIRTPLNAVLGLSDLLIDTRLDSQQREFAESIHKSGETLLSLINDILDFSKIESGRLELERVSFSLRDCLESAMELARQPAASKGLDLLLWIEDDVPEYLAGDVTRLRQVLVNLVNNAVKFTAKGEVLVSVARRAPEAAGGPERLYFSVRDTGPGVPADRQDRLFKAFSQVDASTTREFGGTGLGLAICARLVSRMGGRIWVDTAPGEGSNFQFEIPLSVGAAPEAEEPPLPVEALAGRRLLIVDDNATNRRILTHQCKRWELAVEVAKSGAEALARLDRERFDAAILDIQMPGMDGLELADAIRRRSDEARNLPLLALSSLGDDHTVFRERGFNRVLTKPARTSSLLAALGAVLAPGKAKASNPSDIDPEMGRRLPLRILLVEDNQVNQRVARLVLQRFGYDCATAANGREAVEAATRGAFDVILMDVQMPEMNGLDATERIRALLPEGKRPWVIAMTANAMDGDREACFAAGMDDYVAKPIAARQLARALEKAAAGRMAGS